MPAGFEISAQLFIVVDLPVQHDLDGAVLIADRLVAAPEVYNRQTAVHQPESWFGPKSLGVRPSVGNASAHRFQNDPSDRAGRVCVQDSGYAAHIGSTSLVSTLICWF